MQMLVGKCNLNSKTNSKQEHDRMSSRWLLLLLLARNNSCAPACLVVLATLLIVGIEEEQ